jgi:type II secretory pathway component HofQ
MATATNFDFKAYNEVMKNANTGLKLFLAEQLMGDVTQSYMRFKSPLKNDANDIFDELGTLRDAHKKQAANANKQGPADIEPNNQSTSADANDAPLLKVA